MRSNDLLRTFIREAIDLGKTQFAPQRIDIPEEEKSEENTPEEDKLLNAIMDFVMDNKPFSHLQIEQLRSLMHDPRYKRFFKVYNEGDPVYRGLRRVPREMLKEWIGTDVEEEIDRQASDRAGWRTSLSTMTIKPSGLVSLYDESGKFVPRTGMSFSKSLEEATEFSIGPKDNGWASVVLVADPADNPDTFLDFSGGIYSLEGTALRQVEQEVLALGPVKVKEVRWKTNKVTKPR